MTNNKPAKHNKNEKRVTREKKPRRTPQRMAILSFLEGNTSHPSAEEIHKALSPLFPTMSLATVYNTLRSLRLENGVLELRIDADRMRFDPNTKPHHHIICLACGKVVDVFRDLDIERDAADTSGFHIIRSEVSFYGYCPECDRARRN